MTTSWPLHLNSAQMGMDPASKKKWIWGCSGCLVLAILFIGLALGGVRVLAGCWGKFQEQNTAAIHSVFGSEAPRGYLGMAYDLKRQKRKVAIMMNAQANKILLLSITPTTPTHEAILYNEDSEAAEAFVEENLQLVTQYSATMKGIDMMPEKLHAETLPTGQRYLVLNGTMNNREANTFYDPVVFGILLLKNNQTGFAMVSNLESFEIADTAHDFSTEYDQLSEALESILTETALDDQMQSVQK